MLLVRFLVAMTILVVSNAEEDHGYDSEPIHEYDHHDSHEDSRPKPYHFGYEIDDHHGKQHRHEHSDGEGTVRGSYGFVDEKGVHRQVYYVADHHGFRAQVITNEKGTESHNPADVLLHSLYNPHQDNYHSEEHK